MSLMIKESLKDYVTYIIYHNYNEIYDEIIESYFM